MQFSTWEVLQGIRSQIAGCLHMRTHLLRMLTTGWSCLSMSSRVHYFIY